MGTAMPNVEELAHFHANRDFLYQNAPRFVISIVSEMNCGKMANNGRLVQWIWAITDV